MSENQNTLILAALGRLESGQAQFDAKLDRFESAQTDLYAGLVTRVERLQDAVAAMQTRMDTQDEVLSRFRTDLVEELGRTRSALMARMDRLQEALVVQHEAEVVNFGAAERAERIAKGAIDEGRILGEQFNALVRKVRRLEEEVRTLRGGI